MTTAILVEGEIRFDINPHNNILTMGHEAHWEMQPVIKCYTCRNIFPDTQIHNGNCPKCNKIPCRY